MDLFQKARDLYNQAKTVVSNKITNYFSPKTPAPKMQTTLPASNPYDKVSSSFVSSLTPQSKQQIFQSVDNKRNAEMQNAAAKKQALSTNINNIKNTWLRGVVNELYNPSPTISGFAKNTLGKDVGSYVANRYTDPLINIYPSAQKAFGKNRTWQERAEGGVGLLSGFATMVPDPVGDIMLPAYDYAKGYSASARRGGTLEQRLEAAKKSLTLENPTGLGTALSNDPMTEQALNLLELPIMLTVMGKLNKKGTADTLTGLVNNAKNKEEFVQTFTNIIKDSKYSRFYNRLQEAGLGNPADIYKIVKEGGTLPSLGGQSKLTLEQIKATNKLPEIMMTTSKSKAYGKTKSVVDSFIDELEAAAKRPGNQYPATNLYTDSSKQYGATIKGGGFTGQVATDIKNTFSDWINTRRASKVEGMIKQKQFADLDSQGVEGILEFNKGSTAGRFKDVKNFFDGKYKLVKDSGIDVNYKKNYLPQLWEESPEQVQQVLGRKLSTKPSFSMHSVIQDYEEGMKAGLTPKYKSISELVGWYEKSANKVLADMNFFNKVANEGLIQPSGKAPAGWKILNPESFPKVKVLIPGDGKYVGNYSAPSELSDMINNYLLTPETGNIFQRNLANIANYASATKNRMLSFGIPGTAINFHAFNILARSYLEGGVGGTLKTAWYMVNPEAAAKYVNNNIALTPDATKSGLTFSTGEYASKFEDGSKATGLPKFLEGFGKKWDELFESPLFDKLITAKKIEGWDKLWKEYSKSMPEATAKKEAAKFINTVYGGINWEQVGRSRDVQNFFRSAALTPDWLESNIRLGGGMIKSLFNFKNPAGKAYRKAFTNLVAGYAGLNAINKITSGHYMYENEPGHTFEVEVGYTADGQKRYWRPFGTAVDFVRLPTDIILGAIKGDLSVASRAIRNRTSVFAQPVISFITNTNWKGQPIYGKDKYGNEIPIEQQIGSTVSELGNVVGFPAFLREGIDTATGKQGVEAGLTQGFELPFRYSSLPQSAISKQVKPYMTDKTGKEKYEIYQSLKGQSKFGSKQYANIQQKGLSEAEKIIKNREKKAARAKAIDLIIAGNKPAAKALRMEYGFTYTMDDVVAEARKKAIELIRNGDKAGARELRKKYGFTYTYEDVYGED